MLPQEVQRICELIFKNGDVMATVLPGFFKDGYYVMDDITFRIYEKEFLAQLIVDKSEKEIDSSIKMKIVNGTDVPGLARKMRESLIREGLNVVEFGTSPYRKMDKVRHHKQAGQRGRGEPRGRADRHTEHIPYH